MLQSGRSNCLYYAHDTQPWSLHGLGNDVDAVWDDSTDPDLVFKRNCTHVHGACWWCLSVHERTIGDGEFSCASEIQNRGVRVGLIFCCCCATGTAAYERTAATGAAGASTAVIVSLAGETLRWAYVGDSGFAVLRRGRIVCRSTPQQRSLNSPFRLSGRSGGDSDGVAVARTGEVAARDGDVVVVATDGLFDNVRDEQLERVVQMGTRLGFSAKNMADIVAGVAYEASRRTLMGKPDDITVIVALVAQSNSSYIHTRTVMA
ncbi:hypothetical protein HU200_004172 [Digitaria exilis]|uniref:Protein phosphatase n=1 Tax=Digitaria exilis TaxID=1010633 RepID=A0A835FV82_9POAL|nr:hypothetical protein HU200_004172 [Digitaria exilis]